MKYSWLSQSGHHWKASGPSEGRGYSPEIPRYGYICMPPNRVMILARDFWSRTGYPYSRLIKNGLLTFTKLFSRTLFLEWVSFWIQIWTPGWHIPTRKHTQACAKVVWLLSNTNTCSIGIVKSSQSRVSFSSGLKITEKEILLAGNWWTIWLLQSKFSNKLSKNLALKAFFLLTLQNFFHQWDHCSCHYKSQAEVQAKEHTQGARGS